MERRIAAILAADMVGYSRLIELDESGIIARQKRHRVELIDPAIARHNGHVVKLTGDGLIAEFGSLVEAVQCAVLVQREMAAREEGAPEDRSIRYRIGIHIGDVVFDDGDVYGDGVNIAARLEALADPDYPDWLAGAMVGALMETGRLDEARALAEDIGAREVRDVNARFNARTALAVISAWDSKIAEARGHMRVMLDMRPGLTLKIMQTDPRYGFKARAYDPDFADRYVAGLLAAGLPEN